MKKNLMLKVLCTAVFVFAWCVLNAGADRAFSKISSRFTDCEKTIYVKKGKTFTIVLPNDKYPRAKWKLKGGVNTGKVKLISIRTRKYEECDEMDNKKYEVWTFRALSPATVRLNLVLPGRSAAEPAYPYERDWMYSVIVTE